MAIPKVTITLQVTEATYKKWSAWAALCSSTMAGLVRTAVEKQGAIIAGERKVVDIDLTKE